MPAGQPDMVKHVAIRRDLDDARIEANLAKAQQIMIEYVRGLPGAWFVSCALRSSLRFAESCTVPSPARFQPLCRFSSGHQRAGLLRHTQLCLPTATACRGE
jgi:hypothetical protein